MTLVSKPKPVILIQGAQWGSEAKGMVAAALGRRRSVKYAVRTGTVNAGHTVYYKGRPYKMQQLPCGWVHGAELVIGPGAYVHPEILDREIRVVEQATGSYPIVWVDYRCGLHLPVHTERAGRAGRHYTMGATGKGCSEAVVDKIKNRGSGGMLFSDWRREASHPNATQFCDTVELLNGAYDAGEQILIEGTQGTMLDLHLGPYPYTTHKQCTAAAWITESGLSPSLDYEIVLVARTFPIRVAGNSGPMAGEITWTTLAREINSKLEAAHQSPLIMASSLDVFDRSVEIAGREIDYIDDNHRLSEIHKNALEMLDVKTLIDLRKLFEFTTVTKKLRRVARLDLDLLRYSVMINRPAWIALTFLNYVFPTMTPGEGPAIGYGEYIDSIEAAVGCKIQAVTVGPEDNGFVCWR